MSQCRLVLGDCLEVMRTLAPNSVDSIVCDPPYMINFMNKAFDRAKDNPAASVEVWAEAMRVARPGAHLLAFGGDRTHHRMMCAIEDAGWELRTCLYWAFGQGFPKSHSVDKAIDKHLKAEREVVGSKVGLPGYRNGETGPQMNAYGNGLSNGSAKSDITAPATDAAKQWLGWGSALKPAVEIIVMARKPLSEPTIAANVLRWGTGAINVDACRVEGTKEWGSGHINFAQKHAERNESYKRESFNREERATQGRWPANLLLDEDAAQLLDEMSGERKSGERHPGGVRPVGVAMGKHPGERTGYYPPSEGGASRFFLRVAPDADEPLRFLYCGKASKRDRNSGLDGTKEQKVNDGRQTPIDNAYQRGETLRQNTNPCVKPEKLMRWLVRLVTPPGGVILDPFLGSGSTLKAAVLEGFDGIGIELSEEYLAIAQRRIEAAQTCAEHSERMQLPLLEAT